MNQPLKAVEKPEHKFVFTVIPPEGCPSVWPIVHDMLLPAVERADGRWTMRHLLGALCLGHQTLWVAYDNQRKIVSALTTQIVSYPNCKMLAFQFLGGMDFDQWSDDMLLLLERYATGAGCDGIEAIARFGFWPMFKRHGYARSYVTYEKLFTKRKMK